MSKKGVKDWTGFIVVIPEQHNLVITGQWKKTEPDMWWWKCRNCFESSGVMSTKQLLKLQSKGMITEPDGDLPSKYSRHPDENDIDYTGFWGA